MARRLTVEIVGDARSLNRAFAGATKSGRTFGSTMATVGKVAAVGLGGGLLAAGLAMRRGFAEVSESQKMMAQTNAVLKSTGGIANVTAKHVDRLANRIANLSGIDDEQVAAGANMLLTFTNIRNGLGKNNKIFDQATMAVADLAAFTGRDMTQAAIMVGKALNDTELNAKGTITGWSALRRVGVKITQDMMKQAAAFIKAGKPIEAQKLLLRELGIEFGGQAAALGTTLPGAMGRLKNAIDDVLGAFATGFLPLILKVTGALQSKLANPEFVARVQRFGTLIGTTLYNAFVAVGNWFKANWPSIKQGFFTANSVAHKLAGGVRAIGSAFQFMRKVASTVFQFTFFWFKLLLKAISGILSMATKLPNIPGTDIGGDSFKGALESVNATREAIAAAQGALKGGKGKPPAGNPTGARGEGGTTRDYGGDVYLDGQKVGRVVMNQANRNAQRTGAQSRGRRGGTRTAIG